MTNFFQDLYPIPTLTANTVAVPTTITKEVELYQTNIIINNSLVIFAPMSNKFPAITFPFGHPSFDQAKKIALSKLEEEEAYFDESELKTIEDLHSVKKALQSWSKGDFKIEADAVYFKGKSVPQSLEHFLLTSFTTVKNFDSFAQPWVKFLEKLEETSSMEVYNNIHNFLAHNDLQIDEDGDILAYKAVRADFKDIYTGKIDNSVGQVVTEERRKISTNANSTCSFGLHACSMDYLRNSGYASKGSNMITVKLDVRDIVCVPNDYHGTKIRVCRYKVIKHLGVWGETVV